MPKSSSLADGAKTYYRPIEAAIRWSGLLRFERRILATLGQRPLPEATEFPRWPMLRLNTERIFDALAHGEMPYGKEGLVRDTQGFQQFRVLATAVDLRLFSLLPARGAAVPDVASMLGFEERPTRILLTALISMGLLEKRGPRYRTTPLSRMYLVEGRPAYYGDFVQMMDRRLYDAYRHLDRSLRTNRPVTADPAIGDLFRTMAQDPAMVRLFTSGMHATGTYWADALAKSYDFSRHRVLLDVGGGSGIYAISIARRYPRLRAVVFDLPGVLEIARRNVNATWVCVTSLFNDC